MESKVFVNRILNMKNIKYIGLDMDHTLIRYHTKQFESLVYQMIIEELIIHKNYPDVIRTLKFNFDEAIRGLVIDAKNGNTLKLSRYGAIRQSYHGTKKITYTDQKQLYRSIYVDLGDTNYIAIDTAFSIAFCVLYGQLIDLKDQMPRNLPGYEAIALDVLGSVDKVHADGRLKKHISQHLEKFVLKDKKVVDGLQRLIRHGKKIFILTNSEHYYTNLLLDHAINPFLKDGKTWQDLFEYTITLANKPRFFYDNLRFLQIDPKTGCMTNLNGRLTPGLYQGGCAAKFTEDLALNGDEILYIGDHIYGDILRLKKDCNWRTALVVEELGKEIKAQKTAHSTEKELIDAMENKKQLERDYIQLQTQRIEEKSKNYDEALHEVHTDIVNLDQTISTLLTQQQAFYNPKWGRVFRAGAEESYFAHQVERYACVYMEKLLDLLEQSPLTYFRANRRSLPHDAIV